MFTMFHNKHYKVLYYLLVIIVMGFIISAIIAPHLGIGSPYMIRCNRIIMLQRWRSYVETSINQNKRTPTSLYEVYYPNMPEELRLKVAGPEPTFEEIEELKSNPNSFESVIDYMLIVQGENWEIKEKRTDKKYGKILSIDCKGVIYEDGKELKDWKPR